MFIVKCTIAGTLSVILENGSVTLTNGQNFDIEEYSSRKWIKADPVLNRFINSGLLKVVFDSEERIPRHPTGNAVSSSSKSAKKAREPSETIIVDFSDIPDPEDLDKLDDFVEGKITEEDLGLSAEEEMEEDNLDEFSEVNAEVAETPEEPVSEDKGFTKEFLESLGWNDLRKTAKEHGLKTYRKSADELIEELLNQE